MFCRQCGAEMAADHSFCAVCGTPVAGAPGASLPPPVSKPPFVPPRKGIAASCLETVQLPLPPAEIDRRMGELPARGVPFAYRGRNAGPGRIEFLLSAGWSMRSFGEAIHVVCIPNEDGCSLTVFSRCVWPTQLFDWGKNRSNVRKIIAALSA